MRICSHYFAHDGFLEDGVLIIIEDSGHTGSTTMTDAMHAAADRLYEQITNPA